MQAIRRFREHGLVLEEVDGIAKTRIYQWYEVRIEVISISPCQKKPTSIKTCLMLFQKPMTAPLPSPLSHVERTIKRQEVVQVGLVVP